MAPALYAQDDGGLRADLSLSNGLSWSDQDGTSARSDLSFGLVSETRSQALSFGFSSGLELAFEDDAQIETTDPSTQLSYSIQSRQTTLTSDLSYRKSDADSFVELDGLPGLLVLDEGKQESISASFGVEFGREAPIGGAVSLGYAETNYFETTSTELNDIETVTAGVDLNFDLDQRITLTLGYDWSDTVRDGDRDVTREAVSAGAQFAVSPTLDANFSIGLTELTTDDEGTLSTDDAVTFDFSVSQSRPLGSLRASLDGDLTESGRRTNLTFGATLETRRGELDADIGVSSDDDGKLRPLVRLSYGEDLRRGSFSVSSDQAFSTTSGGAEALNSRVQVAWQQDLNSNARFSTDLSYQVTDVLGADEDTSRLEVGASLSRDLTQDWALTARYTYAQVDEDGASLDTENSVFVGLETSIGWRP